MGVASGGVFDTIIIDTFKFLTVVLPSKDLITSFKASADTIHQAIFDLTEQNAILEEARDILLPRLMTGMIDVEELDVEHAQLNKEANDLMRRIQSVG